MRRWLLLWFALSLGVFTLFASVPQHIYFATGANSYNRFGWPRGWLTRNEYKTYVSDGGPYQVSEYRVHWYVSDWTRFACGALVAVTLPGVLLVGVRFGMKRRTGVPTSGSSQ